MMRRRSGLLALTAILIAGGLAAAAASLRGDTSGGTRDELQPSLDALYPRPVVRTGTATITAQRVTTAGSYETKAPARVSFRYGRGSGALTEQTSFLRVPAGRGRYVRRPRGLSAGASYRYRAVITTDQHEVAGATKTFVAP